MDTAILKKGFQIVFLLSIDCKLVYAVTSASIERGTYCVEHTRMYQLEKAHV